MNIIHCCTGAVEPFLWMAGAMVGLSTKSTGLAQTTRRGPTGPPAAGWVVVGKLARALAGPVTVTGAVHKAVEFVGKAGCIVKITL